MLNGSKRGHCVRARAQPSSMSTCARNRPPRSSMRPASRNPKSKTLNTNSVILSDSSIHLAEKVVWLGKITQVVKSDVQLLSPFASSGRTADIMPLRARFRTVESKHVDDNMHACTCSMAKNVDILLAHALSHQECQSDVGFARLAPQRVVSPHAWAIWGKRSSRPKFRRPPHHHQTVLSRPRTAKISPYSLKK